MAKILFGVAGEGLGHATRASITIKYLENQGHKVKVITYHKGYWALKNNFDVQKIFGLRFAHKNGNTTYPGTILENIKKTPEATRSFQDIKKLVKTFQPDIIFTDLEPFSSLMAHLYHLPLISIDNQHRITQGKVKYDKKWLVDYLINKTGVSTVAFGAEAYIITSFFNFEITHPNTYIIPPILSNKILQAKPVADDYILIYTTIANADNLIKILGQQKKEKFIIYGTNKAGKMGNCIFKKQSKEGFLKDLISAKAVIASAGFALISEALYLKKPYFALPIKKRVEQLINAYYLKDLGYGNYSEKLTANELDAFIKNIPFYKQKLKKYKRTDNAQLYKLLDSLLDKLLK